MKKTRLLALFIFIILLVSIGLASAASIEVPVTSLGETSVAKNVNQFAPPECSHINLENIIVISAGQSPTSGNDLILGGSGLDLISAGAGDDCVLGGGGNDIIFGQRGDDILIGGPGNDTCTDIFGQNKFYDCEI